jgi:UDP-GlcNAc:undecaprenyl-phosphate GlcNAc-1-phosphate transferase
LTTSAYLQVCAAFVAAFLLSLSVMPLAVSLGRRTGMVVSPRLFGKGSPPISYLGGAALAVAAGAGFTLAGGLLREAGTLLGASLVLLSFGLVDDRARSGGISPALRVSVEVVVATWVWWAGLRSTPSGVAWVDALLTIFFLVAASNAFNLLDNMDGVAGTTAATIAAGLFGLALFGGQYLVATLAAAIFGASLGFLRHNLVQPRLYLGNGGSLFLGFLLAATTLKLRLPIDYPWGLLAAISVLAVPAMDTSLVILSRLWAGRSMFQGGVDHLSHRLVHLGLTPKTTAYAHCAGSALGAGAAMVAVLMERNEPLMLALAGFAIAGLSMLRVRVYEPVLVGADALSATTHPQAAEEVYPPGARLAQPAERES